MVKVVQVLLTVNAIYLPVGGHTTRDGGVHPLVLRSSLVYRSTGRSKKKNKSTPSRSYSTGSLV